MDLTNRDDLTALLHAEIPKLSGAQRQLALYLLSHPERVSFMTTTELAQAVGTSQSSVTRFAARLGFKSYSSLSRVLSAVVLDELHSKAPAERFERSAMTTRYADLLAQETANMWRLADVVESTAFARCIGLLARSQRIVVAGFAAGSSVAEHASLYFARIHPDVRCVTTFDASLLTQLLHWGEQDCAVLFAAPRLTKDAVLFLKALRQRGVPVLLVADPSCLMDSDNIHETLIVPVTLGPTTAVPAAMLTLASLMVDGLALERPERTIKTLQTFEEISAEGQLFFYDTSHEGAYWQEQINTLTQRGTPGLDVFPDI